MNSAPADLIALVTGANKGIGLETARLLGAAGFTVFVGARDEERGTAAATELCSGGADARFVRLDVTDGGSVANAAAAVDEAVGRLDLLVNNAGILLERHFPKPSEVSVELMRETFETNVFGAVAVTNAMLPLLRRAPAARVVNVSSWLGSTTSAAELDARWLLLLAYNTSKAALNSATLQYARELHDSGIVVVAVDPGHCATDINGHNGERTAAEAAAVVVSVATRDLLPTATFFDADGPRPW